VSTRRYPGIPGRLPVWFTKVLPSESEAEAELLSRNTQYGVVQ
jgi:hypothetical protein